MHNVWNAILAWFSAEEKTVGDRLSRYKGEAVADFDHAIDVAHADLEASENWLHGLAEEELARLEDLFGAVARRLKALEQAGVILEADVHDRLAALMAKVA